MSCKRTPLATWTWRLADSNSDSKADELNLKQWTPVSRFPSVIQQELLTHNLIPNYHIGENERQIQWVGACDWEYRTTFATPSCLSQSADLIFEGLDTYATVTLNGKEILKSENMFIPARVPVSKLLQKDGQQNEVVIYFESALKAGLRLEEKHGKRKSIMRDPRRNHLRKAQYSWGWDWGPIVVTAGPWKPVYLEIYETRIENVNVQTTNLAKNHESAEITITISISHPNTGSQALVRVEDAAGTEVSKISIPLNGQKEGSVEWQMKEPKLWWCNGQGAAHLYTANVQLLSSTSGILDETSMKFGIRTIEVVQRPLKAAPGKTFMFCINGRNIFAQGGNWIPADNILPSITRDRYFDWIRLGAYGHLNMVRVWGGGIYESDDFFDACDEYGMLVWHDFMFACGDFPTYKEFLENVQKEAEVQVRRLRSRASLALLAGGNEDFMLADWENVPYDHSDTTGPFLDTAFPQREIYLNILPSVVSELAPTVPYWPSSPWGGSKANDATVGDIHQWSVWHLTQESYQSYKQLAGRFISEFGMHGFPIERTVEYFLSGCDESERHPQSKTIDCHNKGHGAHMRIARYLAENFRFDMTSLSNFIYSSQLMQADAYGYALRDWKRMFNGPGEELCAGAVIWQFNDVYPSTSWAFVDYFLRPKPSFYTIRRAFAPISVAAERTPNTRWVDEDNIRDSKIPEFKIFAHNTTAEDKILTLELRAYDFHNRKWSDLGKAARRDATLHAGQNKELAKLEQQGEWSEQSLIILEVSLLEPESGRVVARYVDWPEPYRYLTWPRGTNLSIGTVLERGDESDWEDRVKVMSAQPLKGVWLEPVYDGTEAADDKEPLWEDNMLDIMPGTELSVGVKGLRGRRVKARFMYDWEV